MEPNRNLIGMDGEEYSSLEALREANLKYLRRKTPQKIFYLKLESKNKLPLIKEINIISLTEKISYKGEDGREYHTLEDLEIANRAYSDRTLEIFDRHRTSETQEKPKYRIDGK